MGGTQAAFVWMTAARDARWRWKRFVVGGVAAALVLSLSVLMAGMVAHIDEEIDRTIAVTSAAGYVVAAETPGPFTSVSPIAMAIGDQLAAAGTPGSPLITVLQSINRPDGALDVYLIGFAEGGHGEPDVRVGRLPQAPGEIVVDESTGQHIGDVLVMSGHPFTVVGTTSGLTVLGDRPIVFLHIDDAQRIVLGGQPLVMAFAVDQPLSNLPPGTAYIDRAAGERDLRRPLGRVIASVAMFRALLWVVAGAIVGAILYLSALERGREMAVYKATGAASRDLVVGLLLQALGLALIAGAAAIALAFVLAPLFPSTVALPVPLLASAPLVAIVVGVLGSLAGVRRMLTVDPALAFGGP